MTTPPRPPERAPPTRTDSTRQGVAVAIAALLHVAVAVVSWVSEPVPRLLTMPRDAVELFEYNPPEPPPKAADLVETEPEVVEPPPLPPPTPPEPSPRKPPPEPEEPEPEEPEPDEPEPTDDVVPVDDVEPVDDTAPPDEVAPSEPAAAPLPMPVPVVKDTPSPDSAPIVKLPNLGPTRGKPSLLGKVMGRGTDPFGTSMGTYEGALEFKADGPMNDEKRAEKLAKKMIEDEMAVDSVSAGLADDYFRELKLRMQNQWRPSTKNLSDGGKGTERLGMMKDFAVNTQAWGEMFKLYQEMAEQYGTGKSVKMNRDRLGMAREYFRSKKGNLRLQAIAEVIVTQAANGKVLTIEFPMASGHEAIDEDIKDAITSSVAIMPYEPPPRLSFGRAFRSKWRLRATWRMIPPTALLSGNSWDISENGVEMDVPFQIKLETNIMLLSFDNRSRDVSSF